jgi:hypothetical protein
VEVAVAVALAVAVARARARARAVVVLRGVAGVVAMAVTVASAVRTRALAMAAVAAAVVAAVVGSCGMDGGDVGGGGGGGGVTVTPVLPGNVGICVCWLHPPKDRHLRLLPTCQKCRPDTSATFCYVSLFFRQQSHVGGECRQHSLLQRCRNQY